MKVLIIPDKFKGTFTATEISEFIAEGLPEDFLVEKIPFSDGGDGFLDVVANFWQVEKMEGIFLNALFEPVKSYFFVLDDKVFIECAKTCGLTLIPPYKRNPLNTTSFGLGQQIKRALYLNPKAIIIGLGGSATNDLGMGMASALGFKFRDINGRELKPVGKNLFFVSEIIPPASDFKTLIVALTDVRNPLLGNDGAARTFAAQKGASEKDIEFLELGANNFVNVVKKYLNVDLNVEPGEGAAGGLAAGLKAFLNAKIVPAIDFFLKTTDIEQKIKNADIIITGEGAIDKTSFNGKLLGEIYSLAQKYNKQTIAICGVLKDKISLPGLKILPLFTENINLELAKRLTKNRIISLLKNFFK